MKINTALILCAGLGKRLNPFTLYKPKPLLELNNITMLENCIRLIIKCEIKKIYLNTFYLGEQIDEFLKKKEFPADIKIIKDGDEILNTGGGILNMINHSEDKDFLIFNPDTLWSDNYCHEINDMQKTYFTKKLNNILLHVNNELSFDKKLSGDFRFVNNLLKKDGNKDCIFIGCQILNRNLFKKFKVVNFPISEIWNELLKINCLNGFESLNKFYHLSNLEIFKKLAGR